MSQDNTAVNSVSHMAVPDCEMHFVAMEMGVDIQNAQPMQDIPCCQSDTGCHQQCDDCNHCAHSPVVAVINFIESKPVDQTKEMPLAKEVKLFLTYLNKNLRPPRLA
ncbi:MAG: hypothetical protein OEY89_17695 [Gammaproteobacteria bacterium]|nr:hypothetical protein [Gammaproteobacteria bacterium]